MQNFTLTFGSDIIDFGNLTFAKIDYRYLTRRHLQGRVTEMGCRNRGLATYGIKGGSYGIHKKDDGNL